MAVIRGKANRSCAGMGIEKLGGSIKNRDGHEKAQRSLTTDGHRWTQIKLAAKELGERKDVEARRELHEFPPIHEISVEILRLRALASN